MSLATPRTIRRLQEALGTKAKQAPTYRFSLLYDKVYRADILAHAYALAKQRDGASGVDGETFEAIEAAGRERWLAAVQEALRTETDRPQPVRRVRIPKPAGGERPLGIPTIRDRVGQTAVLLILPPIFEADMEPTAYGYRPGRTARAAVATVHRALCAGQTQVVDADVSQDFDTIPHAALMQALARRISDRKLLRLLKRWLKAPVAERTGRDGWRYPGGKRATRGIPQGGRVPAKRVPPLLANLYMNRYLQAFRHAGLDRRYGARLVNSADDVVVLCRQGAAEVLAQPRQWFQPMGLTLNEQKTRLCNGRREPFTCLGYTFGPQPYRKDGHWYLGAAPAKRAVQGIKRRIRQILGSGNQLPWEPVRAELNSVLRGWAASFSYGTRLMAYRAVDRSGATRVRHFLRRRHKVPTRGTRRCSSDMIFGEWGVLRLRRVHLGSPVHAVV
ncbi:reverse transcriptase domain-containing protein [Nitrospira sp. Kam-Ns4a]